ncbi:hypothetical protein RF11_11891 [Thelohanellus kitauei]|uniref:Uncharacterized protein n=1 Tax=Thelohanellus kitauei TaxID=669202 RepID=A0A0C2JR67_THEKT|nr:hypothetical protein RF11_11891 [Thelohanellus kitauei]
MNSRQDYYFKETDITHILSQVTFDKIYVDLNFDTGPTLKIEFIFTKEETQSTLTQINVEFWNSEKQGHFMQSTMKTHVVIPSQKYVEILNKEFTLVNPYNSNDNLVLTVKNFSLTSNRKSDITHMVYQIDFSDNTANDTEKTDEKMGESIHNKLDNNGTNMERKSL